MNLVNQHGSELVLSRAFEEQAAAFAKAGRGFRLITFDFHKQCGATSYHKCVRRPASMCSRGRARHADMPRAWVCHGWHLPRRCRLVVRRVCLHCTSVLITHCKRETHTASFNQQLAAHSFPVRVSQPVKAVGAAGG